MSRLAKPSAQRCPDPVDWDAETYDRVATPQEEWARQVLARLNLRGDETVLDAGCGSGRSTRLLLERLPRGRVIGIDASPAMIEIARKALDPDRVELRVGDLLQLDLREPVDAIFSNAVFHWVTDHAELFGRLRRCLRAGGVLEAQCGGEGNVAEMKRALAEVGVRRPFARHLRGGDRTWTFASVGETQARLRRAGFTVDRVWLERRRVEPSEPRAYARSVGLSQHLARLPGELHDDFVDAVLEVLPDPLVLEYVRLNVSAHVATRPGSRGR